MGKPAYRTLSGSPFRCPGGAIRPPDRDCRRHDALRNCDAGAKRRSRAAVGASGVLGIGLSSLPVHKIRVHGIIDWRFSPVFLETELQQIAPCGSEGARAVDKL